MKRTKPCTKQRTTLHTLGCMLIGGFLLTGCGASPPPPTPTPTKTPLPIVAPSATPTLSIPTPPSLPTALMLTVEPVAVAAPEIPPTATPIPEPQPVVAAAPVAPPVAPPVAAEPAPVAPAPVATAVQPTPDPPAEPVAEPPAAPVAIAPPMQGGEWAMEGGFYSWASPYENFGGFIASGWGALIRAYEPETSPSSAPRLNENSWNVNVHSGQRSQEISFDFRTGEAGLYRSFDVTPGHRYQIEAWAKYSPTPSQLRLELGLDLTGGTDFAAPSVVWYPWRDATPDHWIATQETVRAEGSRMTIYLRATHFAPVQGGNTMFDSVSVTDLGP